MDVCVVFHILVKYIHGLLKTTDMGTAYKSWIDEGTLSIHVVKSLSTEDIARRYDAKS